jgi:hypothetical protein
MAAPRRATDAYRRGGRASSGGPIKVTAEHADIYETSGGTHNWKDEGDKRTRGGRASGGALTDVAKSIHKGGLHKSLGVPEGEKIPAKKVEAATHSDNPQIRKQANLAQTFAKHRPD